MGAKKDGFVVEDEPFVSISDIRYSFLKAVYINHAKQLQIDAQNHPNPV